MAVVLTRPQQEAQRWAARLRERGIDARVLPLIAIGPAPDTKALRRAAAHGDRHGAVMFVSANAVRAFFSAAPVLQRARAWAPGPATRDALRAAGVPDARIDSPAADAARFDSESLWVQVQGQLRAGDRVLLVRGGDAQGRSAGREWLAEQLAARGVEVDTVVAYTRGMPQWEAGERAAAGLAAQDGSVWLFSSSEAAGNLRQLLPGQDWSGARAIATHPRIAQAVQALGFGWVGQSRPEFEHVVASIESRR